MGWEQETNLDTALPKGQSHKHQRTMLEHSLPLLDEARTTPALAPPKFPTGRPGEPHYAQTMGRVLFTLTPDTAVPSQRHRSSPCWQRGLLLTVGCKVAAIQKPCHRASPQRVQGEAGKGFGRSGVNLTNSSGKTKGQAANGKAMSSPSRTVCTVYLDALVQPSPSSSPVLSTSCVLCQTPFVGQQVTWKQGPGVPRSATNGSTKSRRPLGQ